MSQKICSASKKWYCSLGHISENKSKSFYVARIHLNTKTRQRHCKKGKLQTNIAHEHRCRIFNKILANTIQQCIKRITHNYHMGFIPCMQWRQRLNLSSHKPRNTWGHQNLEEERKDWPLETLEKQEPFWHLDFRLLSSRTVERITFCYASKFIVIHYSSHRKNDMVPNELTQDFESKYLTLLWRYS